MDVRITGWRSENIRGGLRKIEIDLGDKPPRWTLVQMPNGMGKTTTMSLFRWVLTGAPLATQTVRDLRADDKVEVGMFEVRLTVDSLPYRIQVRLDFRDGSAMYFTARAGARSGGLEEGISLPRPLKSLMKESLAELFVFNGELAAQIRDLNRSRASEAIRALYRLDALSNISSRVDKLVEQEQQRAASVSTAREERGISRLRNARDEARAARNQLNLQERSAARRMAELERERDRLEAEILAHMTEDAGVRERVESVRARTAELDSVTAEYSAQALDLLRRPAHIHERVLSRLQNLGGKLYDLKLPESISAEFFRELAERALCVCGRPIGHAEKHTILEGARQFLAQDQISIINQMKLALRESGGSVQELPRVILLLKERLVERRELESERDRLATERIDGGDDVLARLQKTREQCDDELKVLAASMERLTTKDPLRQRALRVSWETNQAMCEAELKLREYRLDTATKTRGFALQGERMKMLLSDVSQRALEILSLRIQRATNEKLDLISRGEKIQISRIGGSLELKSTGIGMKGGVSEGQSLAVAYAFLTSLLAEAPYSLPFIVDSPAVPLDTAVRREVGELIPDLFQQMIMFIISSEREGFADAFYTRPADRVRYITVSPKGDGTVEVVPGIEAFKNFHDKEAEA